MCPARTVQDHNCPVSKPQGQEHQCPLCFLHSHGSLNYFWIIRKFYLINRIPECILNFKILISLEFHICPSPLSSTYSYFFGSLYDFVTGFFYCFLGKGYYGIVCWRGRALGLGGLQRSLTSSGDFIGSSEECWYVGPLTVTR